MKGINPSEKTIVGGWIVTEGVTQRDDNSERIESLITSYLEKVAVGDWAVLYRDPNDGRFWELTYPQGHLHGGGPPCLAAMPQDEAKKKYNVR